MPAVEIQQRRAGLPLAPGLLWAGVGLAPVAALLVLLGGDNNGLMRIAVLLALIAVALIGTSFALRRDPEAVRDQVEDMLFEELDLFREDVREDITTAARATHQAFGQRVVTLQESVNSLRGEFEHLRVRVERGGVPARPVPPPVPPVTAPPPMTSAPSAAPPVVAPHGVVRHTETVKVTTRQTIVDQNDGGRGAGTVYGGNQVGPEPVVPAQRRPERSAAQQYGGDAGSGESWSERLLRQRHAEERHGGDRRDESRYGEGRYEESRNGGDRSGSHTWSSERPGARRASEPDSDNSGRITGVDAGDRWASVRSDDRGHELRIGQRRTAMHADESGTELRIEDRWAAVRRDEVRRPDSHRGPEQPWDRGRDPDADRSREAQRDREVGRDRGGRREAFPPDPRFGEPRGEQSGSWSEQSGSWGEQAGTWGEQAGTWGEPRHGGARAQPALPAAPSQPSASSWIRGWDALPEPVSERARSRPGDDDGGHRWTGREEEVPPARSPRARGAGYDTGYDTGEERRR